MGRPRRNVVRSNRKAKADVGDENIAVDTNVEGFYRDEVDKFHDQKEKLLLNVEEASSDEQSGGDEEVFGLQLSDDEPEDEPGPNEDQAAAETFYASGDEDDDQQPEVSDKAWGRSKKAYYNTDDVEGAEDSEGEEEAAELEEKEAMMLQRRLAAGLDQEDFDAVDIALEEERDKAEQELKGLKETVVKDLSKLSSAEKMAIIEKDSPELVDLLSELRDKLTFIASTLHPVLDAAKQSPNLLTEQGQKYLETKLHLCQCYCLNILFYLVLKSNGVPVLNHPVIEVIVRVRQLMDKLHPVDQSLNEQLEEALQRVRSSCSEATSGPVLVSGGGVQKPRDRKEARSKRKLGKVGRRVDLKRQKVELVSNAEEAKEEEEDPLDYYYKTKAMKEAKKAKEKEKHLGGGEREPDEGGVEEEEDGDGKRAINYQIAKNKGLVPKRKKEQRNPRVKHRKKFEKAKIKHKSQVRPVMPELHRYGGERTGIRATLSRSVRIK